MNIPFEELQKVSYLKIKDGDNRVVPLQPCFLGELGWESWVPVEDKKLIRLAMVDAVNTSYFAKSPAKSTDLYLDFINLLFKKLYYRDIVHFSHGLVEDLNNLGTSVTKINFFHKVWQQNKEEISSRFITTELEYIFSVCRSIFDLLQEILSRLWSRFFDLKTQKRTKNLKTTFSKMALSDNQLSTSEKIAKKFQIPEPLADFYERNGSFFLWLKSYRDKIIHGCESIQILYFLEEGFAIDTSIEPFKNLHVWEHIELKQKKLGSVKTLISYVILNTIYMIEDCSHVIQLIANLPSDIAPGYNIYIRGENINILKSLYLYAEGQEWN